jgi:hypothetical protein
MTRLERALAELAEAIREEIRAEGQPSAPERLYSLEEAGELLGGLSRTTLYAEMRRGRLRTVRAARRRMVPASALAVYADENGSAAPSLRRPNLEDRGGTDTASPLRPS